MIFLKSKISEIEITNERLKSLLNKKEPKIVRFLARLWKSQIQDISYQEIREMILTGEINRETMERWYKNYSEFVIEYLIPEWRELINAAGVEFSNRYPDYSFDPSTPEIAVFVSEHSAELVTNVTGQQIEAIRAIVSQAAIVQDITVDQLAQIIRPTIGLYKGQVVANLKYYMFVRGSLKENNPNMRDTTAHKRARTAAIKYAEIQHRVRAHMIARTELAFAHNIGEYGAVRQAQSSGLIGRVRKKWITADDGERVCKYCKELDGVEVDIDENFPNTNIKVPPLHPRCRCVVNYIEIEGELKHDMKNDFKIAKTEPDKMLVFGWANVAIKKDGEQIEDYQGDIIEPEELETAAYNHVLHFRKTGEKHDPNLREKGRLIESCVFTKEKQKAIGIPENVIPEGWWVGYKIDDKSAWEKIKSGEYEMFSVEGTGERSLVDELEKSEDEQDYVIDTKKLKRIAKSYEEAKAEFPDGSFFVVKRCGTWRTNSKT